MIEAAILKYLNSRLVIDKLHIPKLFFGQVLIKIMFSGVCRSQLMEARGKRGPDRYLPHLLGHEGVGQVLDIGPGVIKVKAGDQVVLSWIQGNGISSSGPIYHALNGERINAGPITTFSTHSIVSENRVTLIPARIPLDQAVLLGCALPTGAGMVFNEVRPEPGSSIAVLGLGGVGISALMALKSFECSKVIAIDKSEDKLRFAKTIGATETIAVGQQPVEGLINDLTNGGLDYCVESAGTVESIELGFSLIKKKSGKLFFASHPPAGEKIKIDPHELICGKQIYGSWGGGCNPDRDFPLIAQEFMRNKVPLDALLTKRYRLEDVNEALDDLEQGKVFRPLLVM